ncbi:MAG TPA: cytochrome c oxidase subunit 3, partial [Terriglobia bacterium]|nr:cytochrome c oxidase subunit 3 [Terriglobia bacterium]
KENGKGIAMSQVLEAHSELSMESVERSPVGVSWQKLMMWIFIVSDGLLFAGLLCGYAFVRIASPVWPDRGEVFHLSMIGFMTFLLISSSATMASAVAAARRADRGATVRFLIFTILGGLGFLGMQAYEWTSLIQQGARLDSNPWGVPAFSGSFFLITGFHGSHVLSGVGLLAITAWRMAAGISTAAGIELAGLYWHFVDLVWVFIFTLFYLI